MAKPIVVGSRVALTGKFLRSTGQVAGGEGHKKWTVLRIDGDFVTVDEPRDWQGSFTKDEFEGLSESDRFAVTHRRFHRGNLYVVGTLNIRNAD